MNRIFRMLSSIKLPQRGRAAENEEYWHEQKGITRCPYCRNVHFKKRWYSSGEELRRYLRAKKLEIKKQKICPACKMANNRVFEGEVIIEEVPDRYRYDLERLMKNFGERAARKDPQDRLLNIENMGTGYRVTTTENQLADKLAKKVKDAFKKVNIHFSHSAEPAEVDRIRVVFQKRNTVLEPT